VSWCHGDERAPIDWRSDVALALHPEPWTATEYLSWAEEHLAEMLLGR
jgi:hypothetical protein